MEMVHGTGPNIPDPFRGVPLYGIFREILLKDNFSIFIQISFTFVGEDQIYNRFFVFVLFFKSGLFVDIFCRWSRALTMLSFQDPKQILKDPYLEIHYNCSKFGGHLALR